MYPVNGLVSAINYNLFTESDSKTERIFQSMVSYKKKIDK